jgi:signal transduction histidine kinase
MFYLDYYLLLLGAITILCWGLAIQFASPLNQLAETVRRFGVGDLAARVYSRRHDGIGDVARAFDQMADRMEKLLTAERRLLQDISHELRSPLARLSFAAELARTSLDREAAARRATPPWRRYQPCRPANRLETIPTQWPMHEIAPVRSGLEVTVQSPGN